MHNYLSARDVCQKLNGLVVVKTMIYAVLSFILITHSSWAFFVSNLQALRWELRLIANARESNSDIHTLEKIVLPGEIRQHKYYHKTCLLYFCLNFVIYMYR